MMNGDFLTWLLDQVAAVVILGGWIYYLIADKKKEVRIHREEIKAKNEIVAEKDEKIYALAERSLKVAALWDIKSELNSKEHGDIVTLLREIKELALKLELK